MIKIKRHAYLCDGKPDCYGTSGCSLTGDGPCKRTTDLQYAVNRTKLVADDNFYKAHMIKVGDSDTEEWWMEK